MVFNLIFMNAFLYKTIGLKKIKDEHLEGTL